MYLSAALKLAKDILSHFNSAEEADSFARNLLSYLTGTEIKHLFLYKEKILSESEIEKYLFFLQRGVYGEPISKVLNKKRFWKSEFYVDENVLDPRPDSELIVEAAIDHFKNPDSEIKILDLGTGSGCLVLTLLLEFKNAYGVGIDLSEKALNVSTRNAKSIQVSDRVSFIRGSWGEMLGGKFNLVVSNPPYIPTEDILGLSRNVKNFDPHLALDGGKDGLSCYRSIAGSLKKLLYTKNSAAFIEIGINQANDVKTIFENNGCFVKKTLKDLNGIDRCLKIQT